MYTILKYTAFIVLLMESCTNKQNTLFEKVTAQYANIYFNNKITPSDAVNAFTFTNFYNGGGVGIGDFNKDGLQDVFFTGNQESCRLYINKGDFKFEDITQAAGVSTDRWCTGVSVADVNQDGWDDIYICVASHPTFKNTRNLLFINQKTANPTFKEEAQLYGLDYEGFTTQTVFFDYDLDGDLDAYMLNTAPDVQNPNVLRPAINNGTYPSTDKLFRNEGLKEGHF
ncbi:MAG TPA: VCBS repeat-containing protein, partial [Allocoleopsis sp.]